MSWLQHSGGRRALWAVGPVCMLLLVAASALAQPLRLGPGSSFDGAPRVSVSVADPGSTLEDFGDRELAAMEATGSRASSLWQGGDVWMRLEVTRPVDSEERDWIVWVRGQAQWLDARVTPEGGEASVHRSGFFVSPEERPVLALGYAFPLELRRGQTAEVVIRGYMPPREDRRITVLTASKFRFHTLLSLLLVFGVMGAALALGAYNLVLYAVVKEVSYLYYAFYALSSVFLWGSTHSMVTLLIGRGREALTLNGLSVLVTSFAAMHFTDEFLELRIVAPRLHRVFRLLSFVFVALCVALFFLPQPLFKAIASALAIPMAFVVVAPFLALWRGYRRARFMVLGWAPIMMFPFLMGMRSLGMIEGRWLNSEIMLGVHGFEILTMSLALADRFRETEIAREAAQAEAVQQLELRLAQSEELTRAQQEGRAALEKAEFEKLRASLDALTGVRNRRAFDSEFPSMSSAASGGLSDLAIYVIDLDGLKAINDGLGHAEGDRLLAHFARHLSDGLRAMDRVYRLGGDEFAVLARVGEQTAMRAVEERIRRAAASLQEEFPDSGASVGCARLSETGGDIDEAYRLADERMYREKRAHHENSSKSPERRR